MTMTTAKPLSFNVAAREAKTEEDPGVPFEIHYAIDGEAGPRTDHRTETFIAHPNQMSQVTVLRFAAAEGTNDVSPVFQLFEQALGAVQYGRFLSFVQRPDLDVQITDLLDICQALMEQMSGLPTVPSAS